MGVWVIDTDVLAGSRFTMSPLTEALACLSLLEYGHAPPGQQEWLRAHVGAYRRMMATDPVRRPLVRAALRARSVADFLAVPPQPGDILASELARVRRTPAATALADLRADGPVDASLDRPDLAERAADLLGWVWTHTVEPDWARRRRLFEADIVARAQQLGAGGWKAALDGLRPGLRWLGDGRLQINAYDNPPRTLSGAQLLFIPSSARRGWVAWRLPKRYAVVYPCSARLAEPGGTAPPQALARLLGPGRAETLCLLDTPLSTTQLVALTGSGLGSIGRHLRVLLDAQLVRRRRAGRSVLYYRTDSGEHLVRSNPHPTP